MSVHRVFPQDLSRSKARIDMGEAGLWPERKLTEFEERESDTAKKAYGAVNKFVETGEWPKRGTLPVRQGFR